MRFFVLIFLLFLSFPLSAASDDPYALYAEAGRYMKGDGVPQDDKQAAVLLQKAADQGLPIAQYYLALAYARGKGVPQDNETAYFWVTVAGRDGDKFILDYRDELQAKISNAQIVEIERRASAWKPLPASP